MGWIDLDLSNYDRSWMEHAKCRGMGNEERNRLFFPEMGNSKSGKIFCTGQDPNSKEHCGEPCPVLWQCLEYALALPPSETLGVWAGTTFGERRHIRYKRELRKK